MNTREPHFSFPQKILVLALLAAFGSAHADDDEIARLTKPDTITLSAGAATAAGSRKDRSIFGQYNGWSDTESAALLDFVYVRREEETGTWTRAEGRNLGLDNRELSISRERQGQWKFLAEYNEQVRHDPRTFNTGMQGVGSTTPSVNTLAVAGSGANQNLDIKRRGVSLDVETWVNASLQLAGSVKSERKSGSILSGIGNYCSPVIAGARCGTTSGALLALAQPVDSTTMQMEGKAHFVGNDFGLTVGYYGSAYRNDNGSMRLGAINGNLVDLAGNAVNPGSGTNTLGDLLMQPVALSPDNDAYQLYVSGNYALAPTVHTTFNYSYTHATQNESFAAMGLSSAAGQPTSLNGVMDTTVAQAGISARPWTKLSMLANVRFEDNADGTPTAVYGGTYVNPNNSSQKANSKAEVSYLFPENLRGTVGVDYNWIKRNVPGVGSTDQVIPSGSLTSIREQTNELSYRAELRKPFTENLNGSIAFVQSFRNGTHWINLGTTSTQYPNTYQPLRYVDAYTVTGIFPSTMMDRKREKVRGTIDWNASERLSLQFSLENGQDTFSAPTTTGLHSNGMTSGSVDASFAVNDNWKTTGYVSYGEQTLNQSHSAGYIVRIVNTTTSAGMGVVGKVSSKLEVGADLSYLSDLNGYGFESGSAAAPGSLPDVSYRMLALKLFGKYTLSTQSEIRLDLVQQNINFDEWTWNGSGVPYTFSDNSTVAMQASQNVTYMGVKYVYRLK